MEPSQQVFSRISCEQRVEINSGRTDDTESTLQRPPEIIQLLDDALHHQSIREVQQLLRTFHVSVFHSFELHDSGDQALARLFCGWQIWRQRNLELESRGEHREYRMMFPTISLRSEFTGKMKSRRTLVNHSSRVVTQRMLCNRSRTVWRLVRICRYIATGNGPFSRGSCTVCARRP